LGAWTRLICPRIFTSSGLFWTQ